MRKIGFSSYTLLITYFLAAVGILATTLVETVELPFIFIMSGATLLTLVLNIKGKEVLNGVLWNILAVAVLAVFIIEYAFVSGSLLGSSSMFLTVLLVLKLFDLRKNRDYLLVYAIVFFQIIAAAASTVSPLFFLTLFLFVIGGISAMIIFNIKKDFLREFPGGEGSGTPVPEQGVFGVIFFPAVIVISTASMAMASALFLILPRMGVGFLERKTSTAIKVTGFSSTVDLEALGPLKKDPTIVMRVELKRVPGKSIRFRGNSLDSYDGLRWSKKIKDERLLKKDAAGSFDITGKTAEGKDILEQNILLEPLDTDMLFAASHALSVKGDFPNIWVDGAGSIRLHSPPYSRIEYSTISDLFESKTPFDKAPPEYSDASYIEKDAYGPRIKALAAEITRDSKTDSGKAISIERYLKTNYRYTLDPARNNDIPPLDDFLFYSRQGYCEHYATAMVMLLRTAGVPARIVTGFLQGEWNGLGHYLIVRQEDAHSWVEAYIGGSGWVTFDPTPSEGLLPYTRPSGIALYLDLLRWKWDRYIVHFSFSDQKRLASAVETRTSGLVNALRWFFRRPRLKTLALIIPAVAAALAGFAVYLLAGRFAGRANGAKTPGFYLEMEKILRKKGFSRLSGETPMEFAGRTDLSDAREITAAYQSVRYGGTVLNGEEIMKIKRALIRLRMQKKARPF